MILNLQRLNLNNYISNVNFLFPSNETFPVGNSKIPMFCLQSYLESTLCFSRLANKAYFQYCALRWARFYYIHYNYSNYTVSCKTELNFTEINLFINNK